MSARQIVVHHDDIAANHATNVAFLDLFDAGICSSGAVMVPFPWFPETAALARKRPDLDLGVHLTLNAEFVAHRWRPLTGVSANGLTDADGFLWQDVANARKADPAAVDMELRAQIDTAVAAGIDVTHLDAHMGTVMMPEFFDIYVQLGSDYRLPLFLSRSIAEAHDPQVAARYLAASDMLVKRGNPDFIKFISSPFGRTGDVEMLYREILASAPEGGLTWAAFHFDMPGAIEDYAPDAKMRIDEFEFFSSGRVNALYRELDVELVGMRGFRDAMRSR